MADLFFWACNRSNEAQLQTPANVPTATQLITSQAHASTSSGSLSLQERVALSMKKHQNFIDTMQIHINKSHLWSAELLARHYTRKRGDYEPNFLIYELELPDSALSALPRDLDYASLRLASDFHARIVRAIQALLNDESWDAAEALIDQYKRARGGNDSFLSLLVIPGDATSPSSSLETPPPQTAVLASAARQYAGFEHIPTPQHTFHNPGYKSLSIDEMNGLLPAGEINEIEDMLRCEKAKRKQAKERARWEKRVCTENWKQTKTAPLEGKKKIFAPVPELRVTKPEGEVVFLVDRNKYPERAARKTSKMGAAKMSIKYNPWKFYA